MIELINNYWAYRIPNDANDCAMEKGNPSVFWYYTWKELKDARRIKLPPGTWQIVCTCNEATEEQAASIVNSSTWYFPEKHIRYVDYAYPFDNEFKQKWSEGFGKAMESLNSLLTSKGCDLNNNYLILKKGGLSDGN